MEYMVVGQELRTPRQSRRCADAATGVHRFLLLAVVRHRPVP
jgi:hypothetical protein